MEAFDRFFMKASKAKRDDFIKKRTVKQRWGSFDVFLCDHPGNDCYYHDKKDCISVVGHCDKLESHKFIFGVKCETCGIHNTEIDHVCRKCPICGEIMKTGELIFYAEIADMSSVEPEKNGIYFKHHANIKCHAECLRYLKTGKLIKMGSFWSKPPLPVGNVYEIEGSLNVLGWREKEISLFRDDSEEIIYRYLDQTFGFKHDEPLKVKVENILYDGSGKGIYATVSFLNNIPYQSCSNYRETRNGMTNQSTLSTAMSRFLIPYRVKGKQELDFSCAKVMIDCSLLEGARLC